MQSATRKIESGVQLFLRVNSQNSNKISGICPELFPNGGPYPNEVVKLIVGKDVDPSDILVDLIVRCILPTKYGTDCKGVEVILINTEFQIKLFKIIKFIEETIKCSQRAEQTKNVIENAFKRLYMLNCYTLDQLELSFHKLEKIINNSENVGLVVLENAMTFYWTSKFTKSKLSYDKYFCNIVEKLFDKIKDLNVVLLCVCRIDEVTELDKKSSTIISTRILVEKKSDIFWGSVKQFDNNDTAILGPFKVNCGLKFCHETESGINKVI
ncbi:uncharacterized protein LOC132700766 [Cylas formicarius]|uniref:uncharacterized protein LOC132700766 n=1 Tax=Cylas formicarius TaxID=197179 RepID=UPI002958466F|nr:uncharacterized protein LOC132700766 [Cylas formicarius]XP_060524272.1 uncharacterized protein LOC132700766 [Cylas formicarius]XP_060524274.1 uncharacterized protein LOC132700766 [Cylas formicarius]